MARYRKIETRIWNDEKFRELSDDGKLSFFFLLTHPNMTALGAMRATISGLAEELGWDAERFRKAFAEAFAKGMAEHDQKACLIALPNFIKYNLPESPNVVKAWTSSLDLLPECSLKNRVIVRSKAFAEGLSEAFAKALPEAFAKGMPYQEPEPEQEQEQSGDAHARKPAAAPSATGQDDKLPPDPLQARAIELVVLLRQRGAGLQASDPTVRAWASDGITDAQVLTALETAQERRHSTASAQPIGARYLDAIIRASSASTGNAKLPTVAQRRTAWSDGLTQTLNSIVGTTPAPETFDASTGEPI